MSSNLEAFGHFLIARRAGGEPVEFKRSTKEVVFLAFDAKLKRLVELHVLKGGEAMSVTEKRSALDRAKLATQVRGPSFMRLFEAGEDDGVIYFAGNLNDGEFAEDYVARRGAVPSVTAFCLVQQLLDDLVALQSSNRLVSSMSLANPLVTTLEDAFLQLRVMDFGLSNADDGNAQQGMRRMVAECCGLLFLLLTGQCYEGQNPDRFPALTCLPTSLRTHLRAALADPENASLSIEKLRDDVKEAYATLVSSIQLRTSRKHLVITETLQPISTLQDQLLENVPIAELLKGRFSVANGDDVRRYPFTIPAVNLKTEQPLTVHLLPPSRIVDRSQYEAVPLQMWRFNPERHPNVLRSLSLWENPDWTFLTEEREPGFPLSRLMAERLTLNPPEVLVLLRQVRAGLDQLKECGIEAADLHPSNLLLRVGKGGVMQTREFERLLPKRLDAWPPFLLKLRAHTTMRSLYEPLTVDGLEGINDATSPMSRAFITLAIYLLTGERRSGALPMFAETVTDALAAYLRTNLEHAGRPQAKVLSPGEFIEGFEKQLEPMDSAGRGFAAITGARRMAAEEMESVGAVSDFDDETTVTSDGETFGSATSTSSLPSIRERGALRQTSAKSRLWPIAAGAAALVIGGLFFLSNGEEKQVVPPAPLNKPPVVVKSEPPPPPKPTQATTPPASQPTPTAPKPVTTRHQPVEIKKAIVPTQQEAEALKRAASATSSR